jgi:hypothetical protein
MYDINIIFSEISRKVCGKDVKFGIDHHQTSTTISGTDYIGILHEICHWLAATDDDRKHPNLGFEKEYGFDYSLGMWEEIPKDLERAEGISLFLTNHFLKNISDCQTIINYSNYMLDNSKNFINYDDDILKDIDNILKSDDVKFIESKVVLELISKIHRNV